MQVFLFGLSKCAKLIWYHLNLQQLRFQSAASPLQETSNPQLSVLVSLIYKEAISVRPMLAADLGLDTFVFDTGNRQASSPSSDVILRGPRLKSERPKSLDLSGGHESLRLTVPSFSSTKQHQATADRLHGVEEEETQTGKQTPLMGRSISCGGGTVRRTGIDRGLDPLSLMATGVLQEGDQEISGPPTARRDLAEEIEMYMHNGSSPLSSRTSSTNLQNPSSPLFRPASSPRDSPRPTTTPHSNAQLPLPAKPKDKLRPSPSLPLGLCTKDRERPSSLVSPSSPTPSSSSFSMDSLFSPSLDIFKSSVISAGKGVAEKASRFYSRLSSQTSFTQVGSAALPLNNFPDITAGKKLPRQ